MKTKAKVFDAPYTAGIRAKIKTIDMRLGVGQRGLEEAVKRSFNLAKSGGRELDVLFRLGSD